MDKSTDLIPGLERIKFPLFRRAVTAWKLPMLASKVIDHKEFQLPMGSVLHSFDGMTAIGEERFIPDLDHIPFRAKETGRYFMYHVVDEEVDSASPFAPPPGYRFRKAKVFRAIREFHAGRRQFKLLKTLDQVNNTTPLQVPVINYNGLYSAIYNGPRKSYNLFQLIFRQILATVPKIHDKYQFIHVPLKTDVFATKDFNRLIQTEGMPQAFVMKRQYDFGWYFLVELIRYVSDDPNSLFAKLPEDAIDFLGVIFTIGDSSQTIVYELRDLMEMRMDKTFFKKVVRHINTAKIMVGDINPPADIHEMTDEQFEQLADDKGGSTAVSDEDLKDQKLKEVADPKAIGTTSSKEADPADLSEEPRVLSDIDEKAPDPGESSVVQKALDDSWEGVRFDESILFPAGKTTTQQSTSQYIEESISDSLKTVQDVSEKRRRRLEDVSQAYKDVDIDGVPIGALLSQEIPHKPSTGKLDFLEKQVMDPSMLESTVLSFDKDYLKKDFHRNMAAVLSSFGGSGMYLIDVDHKDEINAINQIRSYKATFEDASGKRHSVAWSMPIVREDGTFLVNGIPQRMHKQNVNLPICKVSPTRVSLASNFNKTLVMRTDSAAHKYINFITRAIEAVRKVDGAFVLNYGKMTVDRRYPYEYTTLGSKYARLEFRGYKFCFNPAHRLAELVPNEKPDEITQKEEALGILCGIGPEGQRLYMSMNNLISAEGDLLESRDFFTILVDQYPNVKMPSMVTEWTELKILDENLPIIFILGYRFGLHAVLRHLQATYQFYPKDGPRPTLDPTDLVIPFSDGKLVFNRYPHLVSLILAGLAKFNTKDYTIDQLDIPDTYFSLLEDRKISTNYLKGITSFFELFIDPITRDALAQMHEPTNVRDLLIRATEMLTSEEHNQPSSVRNHRMRGYERFNAVLYNVVARGLATFKNQRGNPTFSINPQQVYMEIVSDQSVAIVEQINPIHEIKDQVNVTYTGSGGRTAQSFVVRDRTYPDDGIGVLSECTPDSGKVAISAFMSLNPVIKNNLGMYAVENINPADLEPGQYLSPTSMLMPGATNDDKP